MDLACLHLSSYRAVTLRLAVAMLAGCASVPELRHPTAIGKQAVPGNPEAATRYEAARQGQVTPTHWPVLSHDAADIQALSQSLAQLQLQIAQAKASTQTGDRWPVASSSLGNGTASAELRQPSQRSQWPPSLQADAPSSRVAVVPSAKRFQVIQRDASLVGVLARWAETAGWRLVLNGQAVMTTSFPAHTTAYADVPLGANLLGLGDDEFDLALDALLRAHQHYQQRLRFSLTLKPATQEVWLTSEPLSLLVPVAGTNSGT